MGPYGSRMSLTKYINDRASIVSVDPLPNILAKTAGIISTVAKVPTTDTVFSSSTAPSTRMRTFLTLYSILSTVENRDSSEINIMLAALLIGCTVCSNCCRPYRNGSVINIHIC